MHNNKRNKAAMELAKESYNEVMDNPMNYAPYQVGERIGQMVVLSHPFVQTNLVDDLSETERGKNGFGSTGK